MKIEGMVNLVSQGYSGEAKGDRIATEAGSSSESGPSRVLQGDDGNSKYIDGEAKNKLSANDLKSTVDEVNSHLSSRDVALRFRIDQESQEVVVSVVDQDSNEVIREIPPEEVVRMRARIKEMAGLLLEKTV